MNEPVDEFGAMIANQVLNAFEVTGSDIGVSMDLSQVAPLLVPVSGSSDTTSLEYGGPLNLLASAEPKACCMHPGWGENLQCPRCAEILTVRRLRSDYADLKRQYEYLGESNQILSATLRKAEDRVRLLTELASHYEKALCVCLECIQQPGHDRPESLVEINRLLDDLGLRWDCDEVDGFVEQ